jgi:hypothetical protein
MFFSVAYFMMLSVTLTIQCCITDRLANNELERMRKEVDMVYHKYYSGTWLGGMRKITIFILDSWCPI